MGSARFNDGMSGDDVEEFGPSEVLGHSEDTNHTPSKRKLEVTWTSYNN